MNIFIIINKDVVIENPDDIKVNMVYGLYNSRSKSFWECKLVNNKMKENKYIIKEINLDDNKISNTYKMYDNYSVIDKKDYKYKIKRSY